MTNHLYILICQLKHRTQPLNEFRRPVILREPPLAIRRNVLLLREPTML